MALRDPDALNKIWRKTLDVAGDRRSHLPATVEASQLAAELAVTDLAATGMLRQLRVAGIAREATGRQSFRAFTLKLWENAPRNQRQGARDPMGTKWAIAGGDDVTAMQRRPKRREDGCGNPRAGLSERPDD